MSLTSFELPKDRKTLVLAGVAIAIVFVAMQLMKRQSASSDVAATSPYAPLGPRDLLESIRTTAQATSGGGAAGFGAAAALGGSALDLGGRVVEVLGRASEVQTESLARAVESRDNILSMLASSLATRGPAPFYEPPPPRPAPAPVMLPAESPAAAPAPTAVAPSAGAYNPATGQLYVPGVGWTGGTPSVRSAPAPVRGPIRGDEGILERTFG